MPFAESMKAHRKAKQMRDKAKRPPKAPKPPPVAEPPPKPKGRSPAQMAQSKRLGDSNRTHANVEEARQAQINHVIRWQRSNLPFSKDIGPFLYERIDWDRRLACKDNFQLYCETYHQPVFYYGWSTNQLIVLKKAETVAKEGGKFCLAMERGGGKTAICRSATLWATLYAYKHFIYNVASTQPKSEQTLNFIQVQLTHNPLLIQDFPEVCWPFVCLRGTNRMAKSQMFMGRETHVHLGAEEVRYPTLILPKEIQAALEEKDPTCVKRVPQAGPDVFIPTNNGVILRCSGIDGSIRGEAEADPVTLDQPRPDLCLLDDVQKDQKADSPILCEKLIRLIDGAVTGLSGGGKHIDVLMPCTVIREGDAAETFLDPLLKPDYQGERLSLVKSWPAGITDHEITTDTDAGKLWNAYAELRRTSLRDKGTIKPATELYSQNREIMDSGFITSWAERFDKRSEISAQQHAMDLRLQLGASFLPEYQNIGRKLINAAEVLITAKALAAKQVSYKRGVVPTNCQYLVGHLDIQNEIIFYTVFACDADFNGTFIDYGTWPQINIPFFTKAQCESWSLVTSHFFKTYPQHKGKAIASSTGKIRAPFEAKIYHAVGQAVTAMLSKKYVRPGEHQREMPIRLLGIDTRWGQASDVIKRYIRESGNDKIVPYYGQAFPPTHKQLEEYEHREGYFFENQQHPNVREPRWMLRPNPDGMWYMAADVNRLKDFLFARLGTPPGAQGSVTLHQAPAEYHELFVHHICTSEYPEPVAARGMVKNQWTVREGTAFDNDFLDCAAACMALASHAGASLKTSDQVFTPIRRKLSDIREQKRQLHKANESARSGR